jgi:hypothetical protein
VFTVEFLYNLDAFIQLFHAGLIDNGLPVQRARPSCMQERSSRLSAKTTHGPHQATCFQILSLNLLTPQSNTHKYASQTKEENPSSGAISPSFTVIYRHPDCGESASESYPRTKMLALQPESAQEKPAFGNLSYLPTGNVKAFQCKLLLYPCS